MTYIGANIGCRRLPLQAILDAFSGGGMVHLKHFSKLAGVYLKHFLLRLRACGANFISSNFEGNSKDVLGVMSAPSQRNAHGWSVLSIHYEHIL